MSPPREGFSLFPGIASEQRSGMTSDFGRVEGADQYEQVSAPRINFKATKIKDRASAAICAAHPGRCLKANSTRLAVAAARKAAERRGPSSGAHGGMLQLSALLLTLGYSRSQCSGKVEKPREADVVSVRDTEPEGCEWQKAVV